MLNIFSICTTGSVICTIIAGTFQPRLNYVNKSVAGISPAFLSCWIIGDFLNMAGCWMTGKLFFQKMGSSYMFWVVDIILGSQYIYYSRLEFHKQQGQNQNENPRLVSHGKKRDVDNSSSSTTPRINTLAKGLTISSTLASTASAMPNNYYGSSFDSSVSNSYKQSIIFNLGTIFLYLCTMIYIMARIPQLHHNYKKKSTWGISKKMFGCIIVANICNMSAVMSSPIARAGGSDAAVFWKEQFAFLGCYVGCLICDVTLIGQYLWFDVKGKGKYPPVIIENNCNDIEADPMPHSDTAASGDYSNERTRLLNGSNNFKYILPTVNLN